MDNLSSHKRTGVRAAIRARGAGLLYLPTARTSTRSSRSSPSSSTCCKAAERTDEVTGQRTGALHDHLPPDE
jgi:hypothetical protein